jgi:hypothetical protein
MRSVVLNGIESTAALDTGSMREALIEGDLHTKYAPYELSDTKTFIEPYEPNASPLATQ